MVIVQVTKLEKSVESIESSHSEVEADTVNTSRGVRVQKRKNEDTPPATQVKKAKTTEAARQPKLAETKSEEEEDLKASFSGIYD